MPITGWDTAAQARLAGENLRTPLLFRLDDASGPVRVWSGDFDFLLPADGVIETADQVYSGAGFLTGSLPAVSQLLNGQAERLVFSLSGVPEQALALAMDDAPNVQGRTVNIGFVVLDDDLAAVTPTAWVASLTAEFVTVDRAQTQGDPVRSISLTASSIFTIRQQPACSYYTDADQRLRSSDDTFFARVADITLGKTRTFGPSDA